MKDIARDARVAPSTVSRILNGAPLAVAVTSATRERVLASAERLHYRPNPLARALRGAPTMLIGAIVRDITDPFFATAVDALSRQARDHGYSVVLGHAREQAPEALALAAVLESRQCDAIVLLGDIRDQPALHADLTSLERPVIALWQGTRAGDFPSVSVDNAAGMHAVLDHLAALGHARIAFVGDPAKADIAERRAAFLAHRGSGAPVVEVANTPAEGARALDRLLAGDAAPTAIAAATDLLAFGVLHRAAELGLRVPGELSVTGYDDIPLAASAVPGLTTVAMPLQEMIAAAVALAVRAVGADAAAEQTFAPSLVVRGSSAAPGSSA